MTEQDNYRQKVAKLFELLKPDFEAERIHYEKLPIGTTVWVPCSGIDSMQIETGHLGRVDTYLGQRKWEKGSWVSLDEAKSNPKTIISNSHGLCPGCNKTIGDRIREDKAKRKKD